jgi:hypothetical protein
MLHEIGAAEIGLWVMSFASIAVMLTNATALVFYLARATIKAAMRPFRTSISE